MWLAQFDLCLLFMRQSIKNIPTLDTIKLPNRERFRIVVSIIKQMSWQIVPCGTQCTSIKGAFEGILAESWCKGLCVISKSGCVLLASSLQIDDDKSRMFIVSSMPYHINCTEDDVAEDYHQRDVFEQKRYQDKKAHEALL